MKKNLLFLLGIGLLGSIGTNAQTFTYKNLNFGVQHADISAVDVDNDGDLDILVSGEDGPLRKLQLFKNDGAGNYTASASPFKAVTRTTFDWNDINQDGKIDLIYSGFPTGAIFDSVYTSDGAGNFTNSNIPLPQLAPSTGFADFNNDGWLDIFVFGNKFDGKCKIFFNNKAGGFTESAQFDAYNFVDPEVSIIDYDNDGDLDIFVDAGFEDAVASRFSKIFVNNNAVFTVRDLGLIPKGNGSAVWGDYNGDGLLDLLLNGDGYLGSGEDNDGVYRLYRSSGGANPTFTAVTTFTSYRQNSTGDGGRFVDWDNDGDLDVVVTGYNGTRQATDVYINTAGTFAPYAFNNNIPGVSESSIEVADIDNDSDLDLLITGFSNHEFNGAGSAINANAAIIFVNPSTTPNVAPTAPGGLLASGSSTAVTFTWNAGTDLTTPANSLSYNLFLVNKTTGKFLYFPLADTTTGKLRLQRMGNVQMNRTWIVKGLAAGVYRWGVQSIDNSFMGSTFAKSGFTINANGTLPVSLSSYTVTADGARAKIEWTTASEENNDRFEIERSSNGRDFIKIGTVQGNGTTRNANKYSIYDNSPLNGVNYYRLVQYNKDGMPSDHGVKTINFKALSHASVIAFPNPTKSHIGFRVSNYAGKQILVTLTDFMGKQVYKEEIQIANGQGDYKLNMFAKPAAGHYLLNISGDELKESLKVVVD